MIDRRAYHRNGLTGDDPSGGPLEEVEPWSLEQNLWGSELVSPPARFAPIIDVDGDGDGNAVLRLVDSSTPGHQHLYVDKALTSTEQYYIVHGLYRAGLMGQREWDHFLENRQTFARPEWIKKNKGDANS